VEGVGRKKKLFKRGGGEQSRTQAALPTDQGRLPLRKSREKRGRAQPRVGEGGAKRNTALV